MEIMERMDEVGTSVGRMPAFVARPSAAGSYPAVIVAMEAFGLNSHIKRVASRIAELGYIVAAPDFYFRQPNSVVAYDNLPEALRLMSTLSDRAVLADVECVISFLKAQPGVKPDKIGMIGFCMGGRMTFLAACKNPSIKAAVTFYGGGIASVMRPSERTPVAPLEYANELHAPMLLLFGGQDAFIPPEHVERIRERLAALGKTAETVVYPNADHGFFCDERLSYQAEAASDAWERTARFFAQHLAS
jgi:carboxymethylenebutenolidase